MRHRRKTKHFGLKTNQRHALIRGLVSNLVEHGRIKTTLAKAKELRRHVERAITMGKAGTLHARRLLLSRYPNQEVVNTIVTDLAVRFKDRPGGYTRVLKLNNRMGDCAPQAFIEFVDYDKKAYAAKTVKVVTQDAKRKKKVVDMTAKEAFEYRTEKNAKATLARVRKVTKMAGEARRVMRANAK